MPDIFLLEPATAMPANNSYLRSYPAMVRFFAGIQVFTADDLICGAHMVYGWMPTALDLYPDPPNIDLQAGADLLTQAKATGSLNDAEIGSLADLVNHSVVGASKLLHFVNPESFAIWDSRIYRFLFAQPAYQHRVNTVPSYRDYLNRLGQLRLDGRLAALHASMNGKLGYAVSDLRAMELVMFLNSPP
jgi:hypothetical protein